MPGILNAITDPVLLSTNLAGSATYTDSGVNYDYAIAGIPFLSAATQDTPVVRKTAPYRKPPNDNSTEPGEQSLAFWWIKAQSSFHGGAGQKYIDTPVPQGAEIRPVRYQISAGVDPWTQGQVGLLKSTVMSPAAASTARKLETTGTMLLVLGDTQVQYAIESLTTDGFGNSVNSLPTLSAVSFSGTQPTTFLDITSDGKNFYVLAANGIWKGSAATGATQIYAFAGVTSGALRFVKQRLMLAVTSSGGAGVYELDANAATASALPTAKYAHPTGASWTWTGITDGPGAIYAAGYAGDKSTIYKFVLDSQGATPTLSTGITVADMPPGERILNINSYLSSVIGIVTTKGLRVGLFNTQGSSGDFSYGPVTIPFLTAPTAGAVVGSDRFLYVTYTDSSGVAGLARADISQQLTIRQYSYTPDLRFAWAPDLRATWINQFYTGTAVDVKLYNGRLVFLVPGTAVFMEHASHLTPTATLTTSRIRYETLDPKLVRYVRARADGTDGQLSVAVNVDADSGGATNVSTYIAAQRDTGDAPVSLPPLQFATVSFTLTRGGNPALGPTLLGYQLKALPAQKRQRFIQLPLSCYDHETDNTGQRIGGDGTALARLLALEALESTGDLVTLQHLAPYRDNAYTALCVIEESQFTQTSAPTDRQGWGGILMVTLRTVS